MKWERLVSPALLPVYAFAATIVGGASLLRLPWATTQPISWLDALFTATSAVCVTGLTVVDTGTRFTLWGQNTILALIQLGGLGIMTYTSLVFYLWRRRVSFTDRIAVGGALLADPRFRLGRFLVDVVVMTIGIELAGAFLLWTCGMRLYDAFFHAISAFCNAGFSTYSDNLMGFRGNIAVQCTIMALIFLGGIGFYVLVDLRDMLWQRRSWCSLGWQSRLVLSTSFWLIAVGGVVLAIMEKLGHGELSWGQAALDGVFHAVSARTAGFNTVDLARLADVSLLFLVFLMLVGGSPASCAGGIKTTTLRVLWGFAVAQIKGRRQVVVAGAAVDTVSFNKAIALVVCSTGLLAAAILGLLFLEAGVSPHGTARSMLLELIFEAVSAFGTVGLSTGITASLTPVSKMVLIGLMFVGRLGPAVFLTLLQTWQEPEHFAWPERSISIG